MIIFPVFPWPWELFITAAGRELLYCSSTSLGWVLLMKQPCDQTEIMLEEACIIRPAFNYCDIWPAGAALHQISEQCGSEEQLCKKHNNQLVALVCFSYPHVELNNWNPSKQDFFLKFFQTRDELVSICLRPNAY